MEEEGEQASSTPAEPMEAEEEKPVDSEDKIQEVPEKHTHDDDFVWEEYLEEIQAEGAPPSAFLHVEKSLESGMEENQLLEVVHQMAGDLPSGYWVAKIITICGPLLRLRYITPVNVNVEIWKEVSSGRLHPLGWCDQHGIPLTTPQDVSRDLQNDTFLTDAKKAIEDAQSQGHSVPEEALEGDGYTAVDRIKHGMKVEVLFKGDLYCGWVATVLDNVGGRLQLQYDTPDCSGKTFWLFYHHHRLRPIDWIYCQGSPWRYRNPTSATSYEEAEWAALLEMSRDDARHSSLPMTLLAPISEEETCSFKVGMLLEVVHPHLPCSIELGTVTEIVDAKYFQVTIYTGESEDISWLSSLNDPLIFPVGFCKENDLTLSVPNNWDGGSDFDMEKYAKSLELSLSQREMFKEFDGCEVIGFEVGYRLECVHAFNPDQICFAAVKRLCGHLLVIELESESDGTLIYKSCTSQDLFPMGWCQANSYPLQLPVNYCSKVKTVELATTKESHDQNTDSPVNLETASVSSSQLSMWCPRLYINYCCHTGPYLSKSKVAKQSQSVGPGSVELVLREVLAMTINAAYIPTRALRELERNIIENSNVPSSWHPMIFKAKFRRYNTTASIPLATTANEVNDFLSLICQVLHCCPNLWSTKLTGENCPFLCSGSQMCTQANPSSYFRGRGRIASSRGGRGGIIYRRKRGGRKRLFVPIRANRLLQPKSLVVPTYDASEDLEDDDECEGEEGEEEENISGPEECLPPSYLEDTPKRKRIDYPEASPGLEPAAVTSDPLHWTVKDVELYVASQPAISHHAVRLKEQEVDGRAFLLLNLPTLVQNLGLPHSSAVSLAQHICRVKLAHFVYYRGDA